MHIAFEATANGDRHRRRRKSIEFREAAQSQNNGYTERRVARRHGLTSGRPN